MNTRVFEHKSYVGVTQWRVDSSGVQVRYSYDSAGTRFGEWFDSALLLSDLESFEPDSPEETWRELLEGEV